MALSNGFDELKTNAYSYIGGAGTSVNWGAAGGSSNLKQPIARTATHDGNWAAAFAFPVNSNNDTNTTTQFGNDYAYRGSSSAVLAVGGYWDNGASAGLFYRSRGNLNYGGGWSYSNYYYGFRVGGYPEA